MKNEPNFNDIIGSKFSEREVPFDEANWKAMRAMIDASRAAKRCAIWLFASSVGLLLCAAGGYALYAWNNTSVKTNTVATAPVINSSTNPTNISNKQTTNSSASVATATASNSSANITSNAGNSNSGSLNGSGLNNSQPSVNTATTVAATTNNAIIPSHQNRIKHSSHTTKSGSPSIASNNNASSGNANPNDISKDNKQDELNTSTNKEPSPVNSVGASATSSKPSVASTSATKTTASATAKTAIHKTDSAAAGDALPPRFSDEPRVFDGKTGIFSIEAGTEYSGGWQLGSIVQGQGFNPMVGVNYARYMGSKIFLKVGLQFLDFGHMSPLTYNYQHSVGNVIYDSVITTQNLYFLRLPIQAECFVGRKKKSSFGLGGAVWYLLGNSGYATTYQQLDNNPPVNMIKYSGNAPLSGYNKIDASAHALYRYTINRHFSLCGLLYFELTGMKNNALFGENIVQRTRGIQFTGAYSF